MDKKTVHAKLTIVLKGILHSCGTLLNMMKFIGVQSNKNLV